MKERKQWKTQIRNPDVSWKQDTANWQKAVQSQKKIRIKYNAAEKTQKDLYTVNTAIGPRVSDSC